MFDKLKVELGLQFLYFIRANTSCNNEAVFNFYYGESVLRSLKSILAICNRMEERQDTHVTEHE